MNLNKENTFTEQNRFLVYSDQLNATRNQILDTAEEMVSRSAIQTFEDEGETIAATDASYLASLTVDGKSVQDGTPMSANPVPIEVVGPDSDSHFGIQIGEMLYPIDLQGNVLASLPNGTKDVLTVDSVGHCVLEKHTNVWNMRDYVASTYWYKSGSATNGYYIPIARFTPTAKTQQKENSYCNIATGVSSSQVYFQTTNSTFIDTSFNFNLDATVVGATLADFKLWLADNDLFIVAELATPQTIDLGYITMPTIPDGAEISITAQVTPTIAAKWWTKNQSDVAAAFGAVSSDLATLQGEISALDVRVTALENSNAKSLVLEKPETVKEVEETESQPEESDEQEETNLDAE